MLQTGQDRQRCDSIGRTVLQMVAQKLDNEMRGVCVIRHEQPFHWPLVCSCYIRRLDAHGDSDQIKRINVVVDLVSDLVSTLLLVSTSGVSLTVTRLFCNSYTDVCLVSDIHRGP